MGHGHGVRRTGSRLLARGRSLSLYLFDPEDRRWRRPWAKLLPVAFTEVEIAADRFRSVAPAGKEATDGVVIIHASQLPGSQRREALFANAATAGLHLILVSGGHQEEPPLAEHIHRRRTPVRMREVDVAFRDCFARCWKHLEETGQMRYELLEPEREMLTVLALLCQGYLLAHVEPGSTRVTLPGGDPEGNRQATAAMVRLGLHAGSAAMLAVSRRDRQAQVSDPSWWRPLDLESLREALAALDRDDPAPGMLVDAMAAGRSPDGSCVLQAYLALESHLRG
jgi:hypothetical protein